MFDVPGFNPSTFTDDELMKKQMALNQKLVWASRFGSMDACNQINAMITVIENERRDRILKMVFKDRNKMFPAIIESDPEMASHNKEITEEKEKIVQIKRTQRERMITKTSAPVVDSVVRKTERHLDDVVDSENDSGDSDNG